MLGDRRVAGEGAILSCEGLLRYGRRNGESTVTREEKTGDLKVTDRRMFTSDGELRESQATEETKKEPDPGTRPSVEPAQADPGVEAQQPSFSGELPEPGFADLVSILAEPIALFLGDVPLPDGESAENLNLARFHIDLLDVLKRKTESNLSQEESTVLDDLLYRLRMRYVQKSG